MGKIAKQGSRNTVILYAGAAIGAINNILLYPNLLPKDQVGLITALTSISLLIAGLASFGSNTSIIKFIPKFRKVTTRGSSNGGILYFLSSLTVSIGVGVALILVILEDWISQLFAENASMLNDFYYYIIPLFLVNISFSLYSNYSNALFKSSLQMFLKEVFLRIGQTGLLFMFFLKWIDFHLFVQLYIGLYLIAFVILLIFLYRLGELKVRKIERLTKADKGEVLEYGLFTFLTSMVRTLAFSIDTIMLTVMIVDDVSTNGGLGATAVYSRALYMAVMIEIPFRAMGQIIAPSISEAWNKNDLKMVGKLYTKSTEVMIVFGVMIFSCIWISVGDVANLLPPEFSEIEYVFLFLGIGKLINVTFGSNGLVLINSPAFKSLTVFSVLMLVITITANLIFINLYGMVGAAIGTALTYVVINVLISGYLIKKYSLQPFKWKNGVVLIIAALLVFAFQGIDVGNPFANGAIKTFAFASVFMFLMYKLNLSEDITNKINSSLEKLKVKLK